MCYIVLSSKRRNSYIVPGRGVGSNPACMPACGSVVVSMCPKLLFRLFSSFFYANGGAYAEKAAPVRSVPVCQFILQSYFTKHRLSCKLISVGTKIQIHLFNLRKANGWNPACLIICCGLGENGKTVSLFRAGENMQNLPVAETATASYNLQKDYRRNAPQYHVAVNIHRQIQRMLSDFGRLFYFGKRRQII